MCKNSNEPRHFIHETESTGNLCQQNLGTTLWFVKTDMQLPEAEDEQRELSKLKTFTEAVWSPDLSSSGGSLPELKAASPLDEPVF